MNTLHGGPLGVKSIHEGTELPSCKVATVRPQHAENTLFSSNFHPNASFVARASASKEVMALRINIKYAFPAV
jgi:hypothetical protein